ncbi:MAG TPA: ferritin-like domain-containing protein [Pyrinomonadaceae bacterium]|nr:ferritin-like domain-containing protein [Pyrinomonadaceae bacterium]
MDNNKPLLESIEPDYISEMTARREPIEKAKSMTGALGTTIISFGALAGAAYGQDNKLPGKIVDVLNFALTLEFLEDEFYRTALGSGNLIPSATRDVFGQISKHETAHVNLLRSVLGGKAVAKPNFDFTAGGAFGDVFSNYQTFLALSQAFEDTGVRAYKGQAGKLKGNAKILTTALQIHSVEARHAAMVRRIRGDKPWIVGDSRGTLPAPAQPVYNGEGNTRQGTVDVAALPNVGAVVASQAFDEPLTKEEVLAIAGLFIRK